MCRTVAVILPPHVRTYSKDSHSSITNQIRAISDPQLQNQFQISRNLLNKLRLIKISLIEFFLLRLFSMGTRSRETNIRSIIWISRIRQSATHNKLLPGRATEIKKIRIQAFKTSIFKSQIALQIFPSTATLKTPNIHRDQTWTDNLTMLFKRIPIREAENY